MLKTRLASSTSGKYMDERHCKTVLKENSAPCGCCCRTTPVSIFPSTAAGPSSTRLLICRNSSGSSPPTTVKPKPRRLFFSFVLMKVPFSSAGFLVKKGFPPAKGPQIVKKKNMFSANTQRTNGLRNTRAWRICGRKLVYVWVLQGREVGLVGLEGPGRSPDGLEHSLLKVLLLTSAPLSTLNRSHRQRHALTHTDTRRNDVLRCNTHAHTNTKYIHA